MYIIFRNASIKRKETYNFSTRLTKKIIMLKKATIEVTDCKVSQSCELERDLCLIQTSFYLFLILQAK